MFPRATGVTYVRIGRMYKADRQWVEFVGLKPITFPGDEIGARLRKIKPVVEVEADKLEGTSQAQLKTALEALETGLIPGTEPTQWAAAAAPALAAFRRVVASLTIDLPNREEGLIAELEELAAQILKDGPAWNGARNWVVTRLPVFIYLED